MQLSKKAIEYIESTRLPYSINSSFLITDLEKIIYVATLKQDEYYMSKSLNNDVLNLIEKWNTLPISEDLFFMENKPRIKLISDDTKEYSSLMIFPMYIQNKLEGLAIYFRNSGEYISSSSKAPNTIRKWIMKFMGNDIFTIN